MTRLQVGQSSLTKQTSAGEPVGNARSSPAISARENGGRTLAILPSTSSVDFGGLALGLAQLVDVEAGLLRGVDDDAFTPGDAGGRIHHLVGDIVGNHHRTVLVGMHEVAIHDGHAADVDLRAEGDHVHEGVGRTHPVGEHLKTVGHVRQVADAAVP